MKRRDSMNKRLLYAGAICSLIAFTACEALSPEPEVASDEKAVVSIQIRDGVQGRTVMPAVMPTLQDVTEWVLRGEKQGEQKTWPLSSDTGETIDIDPGTWNFTLDGYKGSDLILRGKKTQTISLGGAQTLTFEVAPPEDGTGTGTVNLTINLPPGHGVTEARVFKDSVALEAPIEPDLVNNRVVFTETFSSGVYYFSVRLYKNTDLYGVVSEIVYVWPDMQSEGVYDLTLDDLKLSYTITYHLWDEVIDTGHYRRTDATLTFAAPSPRDGYYFKGWYGNEGFSGDAVTQMIPADSTGDKSFYAKWIPQTLSGYSLEDALGMISANPETGEAYTIILDNDAPIAIAPTPLSYGGKKVSITLEGGADERILSLSSTGSLFTLQSGVTLKLGDNITLEGRSDNTAPLVRVNSGAELEMNEGSKISGNTTSHEGSGVNVAGGTFTMKGGEISGNTTGYRGGGMFISSGEVIMSGGKISGNAAGTTGGGVRVDGGKFTLSGGEISGNTAVSTGGGVAAYLGTFIMEGGTISGNTAGTTGGGVFAAETTSAFTKSGGVIYGLDAEPALQNAASSDSQGHAVYSTADNKRDSTVEEEGDTLDKKESGAAGGWVDHWLVTFDADGGAPVTQPAPVNGGESLGASMPPDPTRDGCVFSGWYTAQNGAGDQFTAATAVTRPVTVYAFWLASASVQIDLRPVPDDPALSATTLLVSEEATFSAEAGYASYQWYWDGEAISGETSSSYTLAANTQSPGVYELSVVVATAADPDEPLSARCMVTITTD
ncbi:MAG: InlB B-repeat-containing protein [Treponema sp.]|jgi:uncharacterized repeat protein (TIGR02543 family)|nr:InlB B-repeat-containing protein [Treponema sp.]